MTNKINKSDSTKIYYYLRIYLIYYVSVIKRTAVNFMFSTKKSDKFICLMLKFLLFKF